jgi:4-carboxymuconolactone decarboxylase
MRRIAPALAGYTDEVLFGDIWKRPALAPRDRSLVTVAALIATGKTRQLTRHLGRALDNGVTPVEISGLTTHLAFYSGWPSAVSALPVIDQVFKQRAIEESAMRSASDPRLPLSASDGARAATVNEQVGPVAPKLAELTNRVLFEDLWRRPDLATRDRSLVTIAALTAGGDAAQLAFHVRRGLENGLTREEITEAITHLAFYAGWPKALSALPVAAGAMGEADAAATKR